MEILAVIPARGGSKEIPGKNLRPVAGKPLIAHTIQAALQSSSINRVIVSTDDKEIAEVSKKFGADVVMRPVEISGDTSSSESALLQVLEHLRSREGYQPDLLVFLQCTSPLTVPSHIDGTVAKLLSEKADCALTVTPFFHFIWNRSKDGLATGINHDSTTRPMRQEREGQFLENGAVYVMRTDGFLKHRHRFFGRAVMYELPSENSLEIDAHHDLRVADLMLRERDRYNMQSLLPRGISALVFDFDGVFTDNKVVVFQDGREAVLCDRSDGWGLSRLKRFDIPLLVLSTEKNPVVRARCDKLKIPCIQGASDKQARLIQWLEEKSLEASEAVFVGNDINDLGCLESVGCPVAVSDAVPEVRAAAKILLSSPGGNGAVREICDLVFSVMEEKENA